MADAAVVNVVGDDGERATRSAGECEAREARLVGTARKIGGAADGDDGDALPAVADVVVECGEAESELIVMLTE